jgi:glycosyltransferase involved in cell wall biosynthesis
MDNTMLVSVILSSYNYDQYVRESIESVFNQRYGHLELIIVDDGSTDASRAVIEETIRDAPIPVRTIFKENAGQGSALNAGFAHASGEVVSFLDSDDMYYPNRMEKVLAYMKDFPGGGLYQHQLDTGKGLKRGGMISADVFALWKRWGDGRFNLADDHDGLLFSPFVPTTGLSFPKSVLDKVFPIPEALRTCPDAFITRTACAHGPLYSMPVSLGLWRDHEENAGGRQDTSFEHYWLPTVLPALNHYYVEHDLGLVLSYEPEARSAVPAGRILGEHTKFQATREAALQHAAPSVSFGHRLANVARCVLPERTVRAIMELLGR